MGSKYTTQSSSGYNASPPSDDGTQSEANKVKWSTIKTKLADVLKTFTEAINSQLVTTLNTSARAVTANEAAAATDHWRTIQVNTASVTVTLADAATMAGGYIVEVSNQSAGNISVALASSTDTIDGVTNTTDVLTTKEARKYIVNAATNGYLTVGGVKHPFLATEQASTSGTAIDFTGIPSWVTRITLMFTGVSTSGTSDLAIQIGDAGDIESTGYESLVSVAAVGSIGVVASTSAFALTGPVIAASTYTGVAHLTRASNLRWSCDYSLHTTTGTDIQYNGSGSKALSAVLDRVRLTTAGGADTFDAGSVNILYE